MCCCSRYTIVQLLKQGHEVIGVNLCDGKLKIQVRTLDGKVRTGKAPCICEDITKRSAATISKGLTEKQYPRVIQKRKADGSQYQVHDIFVMHINNNENVYCIKANSVYFVTANGKIRKFTEHRPEDYKNIVAVTDDFRASMLDLCKCVLLLQGNLELLHKTEQTVNELNGKVNTLVTDVHNSKSKMELQKAIAQEFYTITGAENFNMSFHNGTLNVPRAIAVIKKTKRKIIYTFGLSYRNPTTNKVPITKEQAIDKVINESFVDVTATAEYIHVNTYSANDMW